MNQQTIIAAPRKAPSPRKVLLLSVSAGAGHLRAAEAIRAFSGMADSGVTAVHLDVMNFVTSGLRKIYTDAYFWLLRTAPGLWGYLYRRTNEARADCWSQRLWRWIDRRNAGPLLREIAAVEPDIVICTHFLPAEILSHALGQGDLRCPVWVQVTDFDLHRMWVHKHMAGYFAANDEVGLHMRVQGIAPECIHVTAIPVMPAFSERLDRTACARELGLDPAKTVILLMGGGAGLGALDTVARSLLAMKGDFQLLVVAGRNASALTALQALEIDYPGRLVAIGYTEHIERLMACADLMVTKPGGLTTSECLAMGLPMILNGAIPGQEERNADYLVEQGVALKANDATALAYRISHLLDHPEKLGDMRSRARQLGRPLAGRQVLDTVLGKLGA